MTFTPFEFEELENPEQTVLNFWQLAVGDHITKDSFFLLTQLLYVPIYCSQKPM